MRTVYVGSWIGLVIIGMGVGPGEVRAQASLSAAEKKTAIIPKQQGFISIDFTESKFGIRRYGESVDSTETTTVCGMDFPLIPDHTERALEFAIAAEKGKRTLLSKGKLTPGVEVSLSLARFIEHGFKAPPTCPPATQGNTAIDAESRGYHAVFVEVLGDWVARSTALTVPGTTPQIRTEDTSGTSLGLRGGLNYAWTERQVGGIAVDISREWNSPGGADPQSVCVESVTGVDEEGSPTRVEKCEERLLAPLDDYNVGRLRLDFVTKLGKPRADRPSLGAAAAASVVARSTLKPVYNVAIGPTLHPTGSPSRVIGGALFEVLDITNANGKHPDTADKLVFRLFVGLPF
jgi:hypothetical protein